MAKPKLLLARTRTAKARRVVAMQRARIAALKAAGVPTSDADATLQMLESSLKHLEEHESRLRAEYKAKMGESRKRKLNRNDLDLDD